MKYDHCIFNQGLSLPGTMDVNIIYRLFYLDVIDSRKPDRTLTLFLRYKIKLFYLNLFALDTGNEIT
jgi:hypothetical protein